MRYRGREIDPFALWERYVEFPGVMPHDESEVFLPKVVCPNPDHDTVKRHFQINVRDGLVHCFALCGISGTYEHAIAMIEGISEKEARKLILKHQRTGKIKTHSRANSRPAKAVRPGSLDYSTFIPQAGLEYLDRRGVTAASISQWKLGWDTGELRIVIPAEDLNGKLRFLIKRAVKSGQNPKYLYTEGFPKTSLLFGACAIDLGMIRSDGIVLVEGSLDTIVNHQNGLRNTGGILGTGISDEQVRIIQKLRPSRVYFMFDRDPAGIHNIEIAARKLRKYPQFVCLYPQGKTDPATMTQREATRAIERAIPIALFARKLDKMGITLNFRPSARRYERNYVG